jgi:AcrR family transcriptional regulator
VTVRFAPFWVRVEEMGEAGALPDWLTDRQVRARETRERVLAAAARLIMQRPFAEVSMHEIAGEAGISIGALYARFPSKEAVLALLGVAVFEEARGRFVRAMEAVPGRAGLRALVGAYVDTLVGELHRHRRLLMDLRRHADGAPEIRALMVRTNSAIHEAFLTRARRHWDEIAHRDPEAALQWALFTTNAAAREAILAGALSQYSVERGRAALRRELTQLACSYLRGK